LLLVLTPRQETNISGDLAFSIFTSTWRSWQQGSPKRRYPTAKLHGVTTQNSTWIIKSTENLGSIFTELLSDPGSSPGAFLQIVTQADTPCLAHVLYATENCTMGMQNIVNYIGLRKNYITLLIAQSV
jgi:hypothetical protein